MKSAPAVLFFTPAGGLLSPAVQGRWLAELGQNGLDPERLTQASELYARLSEAMAAETPMLALLAGSAMQNAMTYAYVKSCCPGVPVACVANPDNESELVSLLDAGVSLYLAPTAGPMLLLAIIRRLLAIATGVQGHMSQPVQVPEVSAGGWRLLESQSVLVAPSGERIALTTIERRALRLLFAGPHTGLSHDALVHALNHGPDTAASGRQAFGRTRLSVMFSRLRRKCARRGLALPVASVHGWGYQFTGFDSLP